MATGPDSDDDKRLKFGNRLLTDPQNVFQHNAWDNVVWDEEQEAAAKKITEKQLECLAQPEKKEEYESKADEFWNTFYSQHQNRFFKDRHWLFTEFPELYGRKDCDDNNDSNDSLCKPQDGENTSGSNTTVSSPQQSSGELDESCLSTAVDKKCSLVDGATAPCDDYPVNFLEVGCGVGNTVFPLLNTNKNPNLMVYCCDFSSTAIQILKEHPDHDQKRCCAFVLDITEENPEVPFPTESLDIIIMIFVLSAVCPEKMQAAVNRLASYLKPGGTILFRDYGRYDMAQLRFKQGRCLSENFYVRGDGTRVYFFTQGELRNMFLKAGLLEKENLVDRRLQVNRGRQLKMYRVWIQCKYIKPVNPVS
ncbi:tRNA N(3)-methylcytidine methyltransferase METTL2 [Aplysia californica]|uniref:tRNA N(3)-methylcytidine methyltransferase n=1 Tax=Aplysia californica TaxID=6500 RepID=A0ABM0JEB9_APLCA|nr:tRNA N(3)-methylcytidine methyltransferase METTL2 [Aplysia californica]